MANHIPLTEGLNTITATATDTAGNTTTTSITVNAVTTGNYIRLISNIESGIPPLEAVLKVDSSFAMSSPMLYSQRPAPMETVDCPNYENCKVRFTAEGIYTLTAEAKDAQNITYTDSISIIVLNKNQLDTLLKGKWEGMKEALMNGDIETSVKYFIVKSQDQFRQIFNALGSEQINAIFSTVNDFKVYTLEEGTAECGAMRVEADGTYSYPVTFVEDEGGIWRIMGF